MDGHVTCGGAVPADREVAFDALGGAGRFGAIYYVRHDV
jgi:hypothetical protein